jgi:hypothetical protein
MWEKIQILLKAIYQKVPSQKMTYHVRGCMAFKSNELGLALIMA